MQCEYEAHSQRCPRRATYRLFPSAAVNATAGKPREQQVYLCDQHITEGKLLMQDSWRAPHGPGMELEMCRATPSQDLEEIYQRLTASESANARSCEIAPPRPRSIFALSLGFMLGLAAMSGLVIWALHGWRLPWD